MRWKSIIQDDCDSSYLSGRRGVLHKHHCLHGTANRKKAEQDGCYVMLTMDEHRRLHDTGKHDLELKQIAEKCWLEHYGGTIDDFRQRYGVNYI